MVLLQFSLWPNIRTDPLTQAVEVVQRDLLVAVLDHAAEEEQLTGLGHRHRGAEPRSRAGILPGIWGGFLGLGLSHMDLVATAVRAAADGASDGEGTLLDCHRFLQNQIVVIFSKFL